MNNPHDFIEDDERLYEHTEPDEGDGFGAIIWPFWVAVFCFAVFIVGKFAGVI